jgi:hypothetical protein
VCSEPFQPRSSLAKACSSQCAITYYRRKESERVAKVVRKEKREWRERVMTVSEWTQKAQPVFNAFIRERDKFLPCISCGVENPPERYGGAWDCGHFRTVGAAPELRFNELNAHRQCKSCNGGSHHFSHKAETVSVEYRERLIERIGLPAVEWLEGPHEPKRYRIDELKAICHEYRVKTKVLRAQREIAASMA